jgi:hypothetical protein
MIIGDLIMQTFEALASDVSVLDQVLAITIRMEQSHKSRIFSKIDQHTPQLQIWKQQH